MSMRYICQCISCTEDELPSVVTDEVYESNLAKYPNDHIYHVLTEHIDSLDIVLEKREGYALVREAKDDEIIAVDIETKEGIEGIEENDIASPTKN